MVKRFTVCLLTIFALACAGARAPVQVVRGERIKSTASAAETEAVLAAVEEGLRRKLEEANGSESGGIRRVVLNAVEVDGPLAMVNGCGTFYEPFLPERYALFMVATKNGERWEFHSWEVVSDGLHGPREACW